MKPRESPSSPGWQPRKWIGNGAQLGSLAKQTRSRDGGSCIKPAQPPELTGGIGMTFVRRLGWNFTGQGGSTTFRSEVHDKGCVALGLV